MVAITVADVMTRGVETVPPDEPATGVARRLRDADVGSLVVVDGTPAGIVTDTDLLELLTTEELAGISAADVMSSPLVTARAGDSVVTAVRRMRQNEVSKLPVVEDGELVGIVTTRDLAHYVPQVVHRGWMRAEDRPAPRYAVRPETTYEREGWSFESYSAAEEGTSVGDRVVFSKRLTDDDVRSFAEASGDTNRLHLDDEYAAATRFGRRIVHGTLVGGLVSAALARLPGLTIYLSQELSFLGPVDVGSEVVAVCEVVEDLGRDRYVLTTDVYARGDGADRDGEPGSHEDGEVEGGGEGGDDAGSGTGETGGGPVDRTAADDEQVVEGEAVVLVDELPGLARAEREPLGEE